MEFTFTVKQRYERLISKASRIQPTEYEQFTEDTEINLFAVELYDIVEVLDSEGNPIPNPVDDYNGFVNWVEANETLIEDYIYNNYETEILDYDAEQQDEKERQEADEYYDSMAR